ncbi:ATP binding protein of ABC transporter [Serinibacter arcticus]|uniref:ATP binding protein of ABC transporter n=2 Tax=Serinibacter arcticus TaxID=1655435 RepID=A0A4Z1DZ01_9MICO|nr:ATP binding protein of ABC transporter [Serinibacter arcticus]
MRGIHIGFPGVKALDGVDFRLLPGEVHALMGENGAGKSTLIKCLTGVYSIDAGEIVIDGSPRQLAGTADAQEAGIATVYQEVNLVRNLSIGENVMLGHEVRGRFGISWRATHRRAKENLERFGLGHLDTRLPLSTLSIAVQQLVAIARAMVTKSHVLILDEPTSSLDKQEVSTLFGVIRQLRSEGVAILFVSHFLEQVYEISDRMTVLRNGRFEGEFLTKDLDRSSLIATMIGRELSTLAGEHEVRDGVAPGQREPLLVAENLGRKGSVGATDLAIGKGEIVGFAGLLGSGRTELARLLYGADRPDSGSITLKGRKTAIGSPAAGLANGIALSSENRRDEGIIADLSVRENMILAVQARRGWMRPLSKKDTDEIVDKYIKEFGVRPADPDRPIKNLSGGNQQKVLLGRWLATRPDLMILDEPTRGIDVGAKADIITAVQKLAEDGMSVVFISSEIEEVARVSDRIVVMRDREKVAEIVNDGTVSAATIVAVIADEEGTAQTVAALDVSDETFPGTTSTSTPTGTSTSTERSES